MRVNIDFMEYSGPVRRFSAYLIDLLVQLALVGGMAFLLEMQGLFGLLSCGAILFSLAWLYFAVMESSKYQGTLGKLALGLRVTDLDGKKITFWRASLRFFFKFFSRLLLGVGFLMMLFTKKRQCLHDFLASAIVVKK